VTVGFVATAPPDILRGQALVIIAIIDPSAPSGPGPRSITVNSTDPHVRAHLVDRWLVLAGRPDLALPDLATTAATLHATVQAAGLPPQDVAVDIPAGSALPFDDPAIILDVPAIAITGTVTASVFPHSPIADAEIAVSGTVFDGTLIGLRTPLALPHAAGTQIVAATLTTAATTTLASVAAAGAAQLNLTAAVGVSAGSILAVGVDQTVEHVMAEAATATNVQLRTPLMRTWPAGSPVTRVTATSGASSPLARDAKTGDAVLVVTAALAADAVEVADSNPARAEYRATGCRTDVDGRWRLAGVRGVPAMSLTTSAGGFTTAGPTVYRLDGRHDPNVLDIVLSP
jgi:hypothetical protein